MSIILGLILVVTLLLLVILASIALDLRAIRFELLPNLQSALMRQPVSRVSLVEGNIRVPHDGMPHKGAVGTHCLVTWSWQGGRWFCTEVPEGMEQGLPPAMPGAYEGECARVKQL